MDVASLTVTNSFIEYNAHTHFIRNHLKGSKSITISNYHVDNNHTGGHNSPDSPLEARLEIFSRTTSCHSTSYCQPDTYQSSGDAPNI